MPARPVGSGMDSADAPARPALCTVNRGARALCGGPGGQYFVGHALASAESNDITELQRAGPALEVTSSTTHAFEIWSLCALGANALLAGTRAGDLSHVRLLSPGGDADAGGEPLALAGRVLSVDDSGDGDCVAVTHLGLSPFRAPADGRGIEVSGKPVTEPGSAPVVAGGFLGRRLFAAREDGSLSLSDPRETLPVRVGGDSLGLPARPLSVSAAASTKGAIVLGSRHGGLARVDERTLTVAEEVADAHPGWISAVGKVGPYVASAGADGVVKLWTERLERVATFPCHADSVYGIAAGDEAVASVSYEGRVAVNQLPVAIVEGI